MNGRAFRQWRSAVWAKGYEILDLVKAGEMEIPSQEELISLLPTLEIVYTETVNILGAAEFALEAEFLFQKQEADSTTDHPIPLISLTITLH